MNEIPDTVSAYRRTPTFTEESIPAGLRKAHRTKADVWGKLVVVEGCLLYRILEPRREELRLTPARFGVIEPEVQHEVEAAGPVRFYVEFYRRP